ncbi:MAG: TetR/AcrR family transcriptional regulator [Cyanobacteria bacterium P01_E01_bin.42]
MKTKGEKTKQRILNTAAELFWQNSYQGVNTDTISQTAGVNKATLYRYFPSKDELALAVLGHYCDRGIEYVFESSLQGTDDPLEQIERRKS